MPTPGRCISISTTRGRTGGTTARIGPSGESHEPKKRVGSHVIPGVSGVVGPGTQVGPEPNKGGSWER